MSSCGGTTTFQTVTVGSDPTQVVGALEQRTRLTVRASPANPFNVYLTANGSTDWRNGFPLAPGEGYQFDDRGARAALFAVSSGPENLTLFVVTEGA